LRGTLPIANSQHAGPARSGARLSALELAILQFLQPGVFPVLALALIVGGWSYGLKLSHYLHHTDVTKASTTRMWLDHRNEATAAPLAQQQVEHKFLTPQLCLFVVPQQLPRLLRQQIVAEAASIRINGFVSPLHSLRAPPISLSLA
jgi:hypothetical protein